MQASRLWLVYSLITTVAWGVWLTFVDVPAGNGFPETLGYIVWSFTMIPPAFVALWFVGWKVEYDLRSLLLGLAAGLLGAGGQLILFKTLRIAPPYLVSPFIALSPLITIVMVALISRERVGLKGYVGIALALVAGVLLSYTAPGEERASGLLWAGLALLVLIAWGVQGFVISHANKSMRAESIFFYMMLTAVLLSPIAWGMKNFQNDVNWGLSGAGLSAAVQSLNSIGALLLVYAFRYGKAMIVAPLINAGAPVITIILSLIIAYKIPVPVHIVGMTLAVIATILMTIEEEADIPQAEETYP
jgi:drug/metabolite transporter (DMT)-like permease